MAQNTNSNYTDPNSTYAQPQSNYPSGGGPAIVVIILIVIVIALAGYWYFSSHSSSSAPNFTTVTQTKSLNGTGIFMSQSQAQQVFGASLDRYTTTDLFTNSFIINATVFENLVPQLQNNITSGWVTLSNSSDYATDASLYYVVMAVPNAPHDSVLVGAATISPWFMYGMQLANTNSGSLDGLNYTYAQYTNSTAWAQAVYGWKGNYVVLSLEYSNPDYLVNEAALVNATASATP